MNRLSSALVIVVALVFILAQGPDAWRTVKIFIGEDILPESNDAMLASEDAESLVDQGLRKQIVRINTDFIRWKKNESVDGVMERQPLRFVTIPISQVTLDNTQDIKPFALTQQFRASRETIIVSANRVCYGETLTNLIVLDREDDSTSLMFPDRRLSITLSRRLSVSGQEKLVMFVVENDSDGDGILTCRDAAKLLLYDFESQNIAELLSEEAFLQLDFLQSMELSQIEDEWIFVNLGRDTNNDGFFDFMSEPILPAKINLLTHEVTDLVPPELINQAQKLLEGGNP